MPYIVIFSIVSCHYVYAWDIGQQEILISTGQLDRTLAYNLLAHILVYLYEYEVSEVY